MPQNHNDKDTSDQSGLNNYKWLQICRAEIMEVTVSVDMQLKLSVEVAFDIHVQTYRHWMAYLDKRKSLSTRNTRVHSVTYTKLWYKLIKLI